MRAFRDENREIRVAESAGFCFGVKRAVESLAELSERAEKDELIYTYGPIIHNETVVKDFEDKGVFLYKEGEPLPKAMPGRKNVMAIRSHGVSKKVFDELENNGFEICDLTCPFVKRIHKTVEEYSKNGYFIVITGDEDHPEVKGIRGWVQGENCAVVKTPEEAGKLNIPKGMKVCVVSQTTFREELFNFSVEMIKQKEYDTNAHNTICSATSLRQGEAREISRWADVMLVIGGKNSSNSAKLFDICREECERTYFLQTVNDLSVPDLHSIRCIGITAGASTPDKIIEEVFKKCQTT